MLRKVLLRSPESSSKAWLLSNSDSGGVVSLDPASTLFGPPCRIVHENSGHQISWRFVGALTPKMNPIRYISAVSSLLGANSNESVVELAPIGSDALSVEIARAVLGITDIENVFVDQKLPSALWSELGEAVELEKIEDSKVRSSIRKAQWFKLRQDSNIHRANLSKTAFLGSRLGSGTKLEPEVVRSIGLPLHSRMEAAGTTILIVSGGVVTDDMISRSLDFTDCTRAQVVDPERYSNLICCLCDSAGRELGLGFVSKISLEDDLIEISSKAAAPAPIASIQLGQLYVDSKGVEKGEVKLYEI